MGKYGAYTDINFYEICIKIMRDQNVELVKYYYERLKFQKNVCALSNEKIDPWEKSRGGSGIIDRNDRTKSFSDKNNITIRRIYEKADNSITIKDGLKYIDSICKFFISNLANPDESDVFKRLTVNGDFVTCECSLTPFGNNSLTLPSFDRFETSLPFLDEKQIICICKNLYTRIEE